MPRPDGRAIPLASIQIRTLVLHFDAVAEHGHDRSKGLEVGDDVFLFVRVDSGAIGVLMLRGPPCSEVRNLSIVAWYSKRPMSRRS